MWVFFHEHSRITRLQGKGENISLIPHYHFHPLHRHLDISQAITPESSPLHIVTLSTQENAKLLQQLKSGFKRIINWNKYLSKPELLAQNPNLNYLNRLFVLPFEDDDTQRTSAKRYYLPTVEIKDYNVLINGEKFFDQPIKNNKVTYENIKEIATGQGDDYTTGCLLNYQYIKDYCKII